MNLDQKTPLREIASSGDAARRALDRVGLDYCCEGGRTLGDACKRAGIDVQAMEVELRSVEPGDARSHLELFALLDRILSVCHPRTKRLLSEAVSAASTLAASEPLARPLVAALAGLVRHASSQMREEEETLYARVRALAEARLGRGPYPLPPFRTIHEHGDRLLEGHKRTHGLMRLARWHLAQLAAIECDDLRAKMEAALGSLTEQMHLENNELLPLASDLEPNGYSAHA